jgi:hypothetical protein
MGVSGERLAPVVLLTGYVPNTHWIGACVGIKIELDVSEKRRICDLPYQSQKSCFVRVFGDVPELYICIKSIGHVMDLRMASLPI